MAIIEALSKKAKGLTREELIAASKTSTGGSTTRIFLLLTPGLDTHLNKCVLPIWPR